MKTVAVLALQGAFAEHIAAVRNMGADAFEVRCLEDLARKHDAIIIPGGESTTIGRLLVRTGLMEPIRKEIESGMPTLGTCAGAILLAKEATEADGSVSQHQRIGVMNISVQRNAYGRQLGSFNCVADVAGMADGFPMTFIRAPRIASVGEGAEVLATVDGRIVAARQANMLALTFHPELSADTRLHEFLIK